MEVRPLLLIFLVLRALFFTLIEFVSPMQADGYVDTTTDLY